LAGAVRRIGRFSADRDRDDPCRPRLVLVAKRCRDLNLPGSFVLLLVVPAFNVVWLLMLAVLAGNPAPNAYGPLPRFRPD
jgi:uncharacterized membrane protein YhaH (DUF805 family)